MKKAILVTAICTLVAGCSAFVRTEPFQWVMVDGSKADGGVTLGIDTPPRMGVSETIPQWDVDQANSEAIRRCKNWGYSGAEVYRSKEFPVSKKCYPQGLSPCWSASYRVRYQCVGER